MNELENHLRAALESLVPHVEKETPARLGAALREMTRGYQEEPGDHLERTFDVAHQEVVIVRGIRFASLCEHHVLPFTGEVAVAYIPSGRIVGLSKIPRMVEGYAARLQVQERLTSQIADTMQARLEPRGVAVLVRGEHSCMRLRGARASGEMITSAMRGVFMTDPAARAEVLSLFGGK